MTDNILEFRKPTKSIQVRYPSALYHREVDERIQAALTDLGGMLTDESMNRTERSMRFLVPVEWADRITSALDFSGLAYSVEAA